LGRQRRAAMRRVAGGVFGAGRLAQDVLSSHSFSFDLSQQQRLARGAECECHPVARDLVDDARRSVKFRQRRRRTGPRATADIESGSAIHRAPKQERTT
jgi:hypothetical protein